MKSYPTKFKSFQRKIVQMGAFQKLQNSIQILIMFWPVYPIHTNSLFWVAFEELPFCLFPPTNTSISGKDSKIYLIFLFEHLSFSNKRIYLPCRPFSLQSFLLFFTQNKGWGGGGRVPPLDPPLLSWYQKTAQ